MDKIYNKRDGNIKNVDRRHVIGKKGEQIAEKYLVVNNYDIIEKNYRCNYGEIDVIAYDKNEKRKGLVFVEVKTRCGTLFGTGTDAIDTRKQRHICKSAQYYLYNKGRINNNIRIDCIEILYNKPKIKINHYYDVIKDIQY